jgi:hypothetical protein
MPKDFKSFWFRKTILDDFPYREVPLSPGSGQWGYLIVSKGKLFVLRTNNYHLALSKNFRALDINPPTQSHYYGMDVVEFTKYKILRMLESFVHFLTATIVKKTNFLLKLSFKIRKYLRKLNFISVFRELNSLNLRPKARKAAKPTYPLPNIRPRVPPKAATSTEKQQIQPAEQKEPVVPAESKPNPFAKHEDGFDPFDESQFLGDSSGEFSELDTTDDD